MLDILGDVHAELGALAARFVRHVCDERGARDLRLLLALVDWCRALVALKGWAVEVYAAIRSHNSFSL
ncbi:MAG: hypothetical protein KF790_10860 [Steroidobacteraceae bacterium]|nr:hypothetical protein [Steroidobacteraceae bacterium]MCW5573330.1 hypothetical protein [Steroidobacteraceae bacterium]